jgi:hypothetical protein
MSFCPLPVVIVRAKVYIGRKVHTSSSFVTFTETSKLYITVQLTVIRVLRLCGNET